MTQGPSSLEIERGLIGATIYFVEFQAHLGKLDPSDFADPICSRAWGAMQELAEAGRPIERIAVFQKIGVSVDEDDDPFMLAVDRVKTYQRPDPLTLINEICNMAGLRRLTNLGHAIQDMHGALVPMPRRLAGSPPKKSTTSLPQWHPTRRPSSRHPT